MRVRAVSSRPGTLAVLSFWMFTSGAVSGQYPNGDLDTRLPQPIGSPTPTNVHIPPRHGQVFDADALRRVGSYCMDTNHLAGYELNAVRELIRNPPKKVTDWLSWKRIDDCRQADAVVRFYYAKAIVRDEVLGGLPGASRSGTFRDPVLVIYDKASVRLFYRAEGNPVSLDAKNPLAEPFAMLAKDVKAIRR